MEQIHIDTLTKFRKEIIDNVLVHNKIIKPLQIQGILKIEDVNEIQNGKNEEGGETSKLLDILPRCGPLAFQEFIYALKHHYNWLSNEIEKHLENYNMSSYDANFTDDLPAIPRVTVTRQELTGKVNQLLNQLKPGEHLAVCGLRGIGKSCLISKTLKESKNLVAELFKNKIYWLKFNYNAESLDDEIINQLNALYQKFNSRISPTRLQTETLKDCLRRYIKNYLNKRERKDTLLILDDVTHKEIVDAFDFGCKTLVITDDFSVVKGKEPFHLEISSGFTENESMLLFSKFLDITGELPPEAKKIHKICKGLPLLMGMILAQVRDYKDQMIHDPTWWQHFLRNLEKNDPGNDIIQTAKNTFDMCIEKLTPEQKECFYELAIFNDDINIMPQTLETLWKLEPLDVSELMTIFWHKSLATKEWNPKLKCYVYGVHNMLLDHLRTKLGPETLKEKHRALIEKYMKKCGNDFAELPADNYIHSYIGHHVGKGELQLFDEIYLNLNFIQSKIINAGIDDLLIDIKKYEKYIIKNNTENLTKLNNIEAFLRKNTKILTKHNELNCLDLIQIALLYGDGFVLNEAKRLASEKSAYPYFTQNNLNSQKIENIFTECSTYSINETITNVCFTNNEHSLIFSDINGKIKNKNFLTGEELNFYGLEGKIIQKLIVSNSERYVIGLTKNGIIKLFPLEKSDSNANGEINNQNPRKKQKHHVSLFDKSNIKDNSLKTLCVKNETITDVMFSTNDCIVACTAEGTVILWNEKGIEIVRSKRKDMRLKKIVGLKDTINDMFHCFTSEGFLITYLFHNCHLDDISVYDPELTNENEEVDIIFCRRLTTEANSLIVVTKNQALHIKWSISDGVLVNITIKSQTKINKPNVNFLSAIINYDERYLIVSKSDGHTEIWNFRNQFKLLTSCHWNVSCLDTFWMRDQNYHLLCGKENSLIYKWKLNPKIEELIPLSKPLFNALMKPKGQDDIVARRTKDNKLIVVEGSIKKAEVDLEGTVSTIIFSKDGKKLLYDIIDNQRQQIFLFDIESGTSQDIMQLRKVSEFIKFDNNFSVSDLVVIAQEKANLKMCFRKLKTICHDINVGNVIAFHEIGTDQILTVTKECVISYWEVDPNNGQLSLIIDNEERKNLKVISSTLSANKKYLGLLIKNKRQVLIFKIENNLKKNLIPVSIEFYHEIFENDKITCFEFSKNEKYLAIGYNNGNISIFDIEDKRKILSDFPHLSCVKNLIWDSSSTILLSVNSEEMAFLKAPRNVQQVKKVNRMGNYINSRNDECVKKFNEKHKDQSKTDLKSLLLRIIPLPTCNAKVCVSEDFEKFLTVDDNGHINIFTPLISVSQTTSEYLRKKCSVI